MLCRGGKGLGNLIFRGFACRGDKYAFTENYDRGL